MITMKKNIKKRIIRSKNDSRYFTEIDKKKLKKICQNCGKIMPFSRLACPNCYNNMIDNDKN
jgi:uncharacterized OB-fold protein